MNLYFAPLEGLTSYVFRNAHRKCYGGIEKYYMPFIATHQTRVIKGKELRDILPEHNEAAMAVPQLLSNKPEDFAWYVETLVHYGYREINLNLGCPSGTVTAKGKGSGMLRDPDELDEFLEEAFLHIEQLHIPELKISAKTRIGIADAIEVEDILTVLSRYPFSKLIVHPRYQKQMYKGSPDMEAFQKYYERIRVPLIYNGDISTASDAVKILRNYPKLDGIMLGRGILCNPNLGNEIRAELVGKIDPFTDTQAAAVDDMELLRNFHEQILNGWLCDQNNEKNALFRMKELWLYLGRGFTEADRSLRHIKKAKNIEEYRLAVREVFKHPAIWMK